MRLSERGVAQRGPQVQKLLRPISPWDSGPAWARVPIGTSVVIIGTHDGARPASNYRDWRFPVQAKRHHAMYFEAWRAEARDRYVLDQAYLNIYRRRDFAEQEIICLHCDPSLLPEADHAKYKRGPHIHMSVAGSPYDAAHIALSGPDILRVLRNIDSLHDALAWGVEMIHDEMLSLMHSQN